MILQLIIADTAKNNEMSPCWNEIIFLWNIEDLRYFYRESRHCQSVMTYIQTLTNMTMVWWAYAKTKDIKQKNFTDNIQDKLE